MEETLALMKTHGQALLQGDPALVFQRFAAILDSIHDGVYITDGNAVTLFANKTYCDISGLNRSDVLGLSMQEMIERGLIDRSGSLLAIKHSKEVTLTQVFSTGKRAKITSYPYCESDNVISMIITVVQDITDLYNLEVKYQHSQESRRTEIQFRNRHDFSGQRIIAYDHNSLATLGRVERVASLDTTVLLVGETGVGKEQFARYIVENSPRADQPFITINCGAISPSLIESELFGYGRGAFTGANREGKMGVFESANHGTLFLDEIGELPLNMQVHLLRVLQEMKVRRIATNKDVDVDVRIIAATNRNLMEMVQEKTFRKDLYYRLTVVPISIPPLRERTGDIAPLLDFFLADVNKKYRMEKTVSKDALTLLHQYSWPGNIRELKNVVEQAVILSTGDLITPQDIPILYQRQIKPTFQEGMCLKEAVAQFEYEYICAAYEKHGNVRAAAASLQMDSATFVRKRKKYADLLQK
ncbi:sigma 54-interacting transcriptional regulator [Bengtsoniella intestinalis]|uniref:sigma-54 interaction domain-containing protein n=1 Tax=Bengtsoniella intestinalis TaxID=3073143 RepID=UPI00391F0E80